MRRFLSVCLTSELRTLGVRPLIGQCCSSLLLGELLEFRAESGANAYIGEPEGGLRWVPLGQAGNWLQHAECSSPGRLKEL